MAIQKVFTQEQLDLAKNTLTDLPDLSPNKIPRDELLKSLSDEIVTLANKKGYSAVDIKSALATVNIQLSEKAIQDVIRQGKPSVKSRSKVKSASASNAQDKHHTGSEAS